jgi:NDP-sugar pyrophosphorylase family protein
MGDSLAGTAGNEDAAPDDGVDRPERAGGRPVLAGGRRVLAGGLPAPGVDLVGVVLAAGAGRRLRPLTALLTKPLCPVGNEALLDRALNQVAAVTRAVAVNLHHGGTAIDAHLGERNVHRSVEESEALGTAGALGRMRPWIDGRGALVVNADGWSDADLAAFVAGWDGERVRLLVAPPPGTRRASGRETGAARFGPTMGVVASLLPWAEVARLEPVPSGLYEVMWRGAHAEGRLDVVVHGGQFVDCGTPADYLRANLLSVDLLSTDLMAGGPMAAGPDARGPDARGPDARGSHRSIVADGARITGRVERSVVGAGAVIEGSVIESVVWPGSRVAAGEHLVRAVRAGGLTVEVR